MISIMAQNKMSIGTYVELMVFPFEDGSLGIQGHSTAGSQHSTLLAKYSTLEQVINVMTQIEKKLNNMPMMPAYQVKNTYPFYAMPQDKGEVSNVSI